MLINFTIENWMCFADSTEFSMEASDEVQHSERVPYIKEYDKKILPITAIFGGNASGKTAFCKALEFVQSMVIEGTSKPNSRIPVNPFRLDSKNENSPCRFVTEILIDDGKSETIYEFSFAVNRKEVLEEKLLKKTDKGTEELYVRKNEKIDLGENYKKNDNLSFVANNTRPNQLFLHNSVDQNQKLFKDIYDWFASNLVLIFPDMQFKDLDIFKDEKNPISDYVSGVLKKLDTGVERLIFKKIDFDSLPIPQEMLQYYKEKIEDGGSIGFMSSSGKAFFIIENKKGNFIAYELLTYHKKVNGESVAFKFEEESDGTRRLINLLPLFYDLTEKKTRITFIVDELERSLHTLLTEALLEFYTQELSADSRSQLIFTTHDAILMSQHIFRRDEIWLAERNSDNKSKLYSLSNIDEIDDETDIAGDYLTERYGGIPHLSLFS